MIGLKIDELKLRAKQRGVDLSKVNESIKSEVRTAIWGESGLDLMFVEKNIDLSVETGSDIWKQIEPTLPTFALFKSDRQSTDQDDEAQNPLKAAIKEAVRKREKELADLTQQIEEELDNVARKTLEKLKEMTPELASRLKANSKRDKPWESLFKLSITDDQEIPINKRGSGTRRLILLNFFRAKAESDATSRNNSNIIYAIEEPETSQHPNYQIMLLEAFEELTEDFKCQVIITTHTPNLARKLERNYLRLVTNDANNHPIVLSGIDDDTSTKIRNTLGVLPDHSVKVFLGVEGKHDIEFLKRISKILSSSEQDISDLEKAETNGELVFIPLGGSSLELWVSRLSNLNIDEVYLTDRDNPPPAEPKYKKTVDEWRAAGHIAIITSKRELENYLHLDIP